MNVTISELLAKQQISIEKQQMVHDGGYLDGIILLEQTITIVETKHTNAKIFFSILHLSLESLT